ncbi:DUF2716 domain-containing protein [Streptomyces sp. NBC_01264]|uniref:DUF2716 domain-containing protein n=1 Tax=Streptomyces sp. NBC_01264 TaxID=2903804 RepID=UPI00224F80B6|nr:DUF2716 domain-containing protein [Streptomyces sp. NBC_01264]MCX4781434.1 DUF2716 domain-containing protein [Streptomyces sp. NBC_01264]
MDRSEQARVWGAYAAQVRGLVPEWAPPGAVVEQDGPLVRTHYGTHGTVGHRPLTHTGRGELAELVRRQQEAFAARSEPVEWKVYGADAPALAEELGAAGFTADPERSLMAAGFAALGRGTDEGRVRSVVPGTTLREMAASSDPHETPLAEFEADGGCVYGRAEVALLLDGGRVAAVGWARRDPRTEFVVVGGVTGPHSELLRAWRQLAEPRHPKTPAATHCVLEAEGELREVAGAAGFGELTTVRTYRWSPPGSPAATRPVRWLRDDDEDPLWDRLEKEFAFDPDTDGSPGFDAPAPSVTWRLKDAPTDEPDRILRASLRALTPAGQRLHWLDWQHTGYDFDPHRVGGSGEPRWPGRAYPNGDYYLYLHPDLRFGTFGHPWERTLCVWGAGLLAAVEAELTEVLGEPLRRRDTP